MSDFISEWLYSWYKQTTVFSDILKRKKREKVKKEKKNEKKDYMALKISLNGTASD